jgi:hypothetical protein
MNLKQTYGFINPTHLAENYNKMMVPINFQDPIETLFKNIEYGLCYANTGMERYMEAQYVSITFLLTINTGTIPDACREWQLRTPFNQTWAEFRREFARAQREHHIISSTASGADYPTANFAEHYVHNSIPADGRFVTAMANLATDTSADRETVATFTKAIATITEKLKAKDMLSKYQEAAIKLLLGGHVTAAPTVHTTPGATHVSKSYKTKNDSHQGQYHGR